MSWMMGTSIMIVMTLHRKIICRQPRLVKALLGGDSSSSTSTNKTMRHRNNSSFAINSPPPSSSSSYSSFQAQHTSNRAPIEKAWDILNDSDQVLNANALSAYLSSLGVFCADDLEFLSRDTIERSLESCWRQEAQEGFKYFDSIT